MKKKIIKNFLFILCGIFILSVLSGCHKNSKKELNIAIQFGTAYAPLEIMKEKKLLEKYLNGITINWIQVDGPTAIREGILAGKIDIGFMGPAPFLMGVDNGMDWKIISGLSSNEVAVVTDKEYIHTLADFKPEDRIAILSPACTQHVLLAIACEKEFGDPNFFDTQLVSMSHPDAMNALIADTEIAAHIATPPYIGLELAHGMHIVTTGEQIMGKPFTFIVGAAMQDFYDDYPKEYSAFISALDESIDYINQNMQDAVKILAPVYGTSEKELLSQMTYNGTIYSTKLEGISELSSAMQRIGFTKNNPELNSIVFSNVR